MEIQHAIKVFKQISNVIDLQSAKRFVDGDPLIELLMCMRQGKKFPPAIWKAFEGRVASDSKPGGKATLDPRHELPHILDGYGLAMYDRRGWDTGPLNFGIPDIQK